MKNSDEQGYVLILSVLLVSAISLSIALSQLLLGSASSKALTSSEKATSAFFLASACAELGLERIAEDHLFVGSSSISIDNGICSYTITSGAGENRTLQSVGTKGNVVKKILIQITSITPLIQVGSWKEVDNF
jgi:hypothetical protein